MHAPMNPLSGSESEPDPEPDPTSDTRNGIPDLTSEREPDPEPENGIPDLEDVLPWLVMDRAGSDSSECPRFCPQKGVSGSG